ncbi:hypothetical protein [Microvirga rosea]|uniref:hypothetical protein n=1 Tax=Microvirga rosea TaxID=2715425 RepID=UPI001D0AE026|nr:hypothetical protein [Microvirga rosea]MCB8823290.1 hypothetical protein [Microvirga rosea]
MKKSTCVERLEVGVAFHYGMVGIRHFLKTCTLRETVPQPGVRPLRLNLCPSEKTIDEAQAKRTVWGIL